MNRLRAAWTPTHTGLVFLALTLGYLVLAIALEGWTFLTPHEMDTISHVMSSVGERYPWIPALIVGGVALLTGHWWWQMDRKGKP